VIASPVGANAQVVQHGVNGFLADSPEEWADALRRLEEPDLRRRMGAEARKTVEDQYSTAVVCPRLAAILSSAAGR
jgi:glycosyltransferase involved in cell wall biosynthesis